jgi:hypothetical protein
MERKLRRRVVTIHGVNPDRDWQKTAKSVLEPHFEVVSVEYRDYDGIQGPIRVVCHPLALVGAFLLLIASVVSLVVYSVVWSVGFWAAMVVLIGGVGIAALKRHSQGRHIKKRLSDLCASPPRPHVIAHSFGTYLTGRSLKHPDIALDRVVLVGSVLPRRFDWQTLRSKGREGFGVVRNELGTRDFVVWLARWTRWFAWDIGDAGLRGFQGESVHSTGGPWLTCDVCGDVYPAGSVHNVPLVELAHSDAFLGPGHIRRLWLPFLWGLPPGEFGRFEDLCFGAAYSLQEGQYWEFNRIVGVLGESKWAWTEGSSTRDFVWFCLHEELKHRGKKIEERDQALVTEILGVMCGYVARASEEEEEDEAIRRALHPHLAIIAAMKRVLGRQS